MFEKHFLNHLEHQSLNYQNRRYHFFSSSGIANSTRSLRNGNLLKIHEIF
ncbi:unnamed protein product [Phyllotreta striolata]|uniref:Uncharacterized protein n=1 Tax=Phyllotreta striolata TaxID=444603 RepID=A0A9N9XTA9_PHYSR|nr:unnamed protein product [Phyllotreta striolata]